MTFNVACTKCEGSPRMSLGALCYNVGQLEQRYYCEGCDNQVRVIVSCPIEAPQGVDNRPTHVTPK